MARLLDLLQVRCFVSSKIILFFIDGIGVGEEDPLYNPCYHSKTGIFNFKSKNLLYDGKIYAVDAQLGTSGFPQSATGHTSLYTGINAPQLIGKHLTGFPNNDLRNLIQRQSIFVNLTQLGARCKFMNAFRPIFFTSPELFKNLRMSATAEMNKFANLPFADFNEVRDSKALYHDFTNREPIEKGFDLPLFTAEKAAEILVEQSNHYDLILFEYFMTDFAGHAQNLNQAIKEIYKVENLIHSLLKFIDLKSTILIVASDHGNIEDLRTKSHTKNPAFLAIWDLTPSNKSFNFSTLLDVYPFIINKIS